MVEKSALSLDDLESYRCFRDSPYYSTKHTSYFQVYDELFSSYRGKKITFVEVGVLSGGSLFMWRNYFGPQARIIGIDFNPEAMRWKDEGFEVFIGNQADPTFWEDFFSKVGEVDILLDDGGHTNEQQTVTLNQAAPRIRDGGLLVVEDTHTSYFRDFGNPTKYSFINYGKSLVDGINSRFPKVKVSANSLNRLIYSIRFFESIVCFSIDRRKCFNSERIVNRGVNLQARDFRHFAQAANFKDGEKTWSRRWKLGRARALHKCSKWIYGEPLALQQKMISFGLRKYFQ